jgi:hypothetical protein
VSAPLHAAIAVVDGEPEYSLRQATVRAMLVGYHHKYMDAWNQFQVNRVEEFVSSPLFNPATGAKSRTFINGGIIDVDLEDDRGHGIMDHKTTSDSIEEPDSPYWQQLIVESQLDHYLLLKHLNGERADWAIWDVMRKPGIRPRALTKAEQKELAEKGTYFGAPFPADVIQPALAEGRESLPLYEARLVQECTGENAGRYFQRRRIVRLGNQILQYAEELWDNGQEFILARRNERRGRNSGACMNYGRACMYLPICSGHDSLDSGNWQPKAYVHGELPILDDGQQGRSILTNSRIRTFQLCRRKEYYSYDLGIERTDPEEAETLAFGTLWHKALAAYFTTIKEIQHGNTASSGAAEERIAGPVCA